MTHILGIDPGLGGALALIDEAGELIAVEDAPCVDDGARGRRTLNAPLLADVLKRWRPSRAYIELVTSRPHDAKVAAFSFGRCRGALEGVCAALAIPAAMLTVPTWRRAVGLPVGATKEQARGEAIRRWPAHAALFARVKDDGRAESALIAIAGMMRERSR